MQQTASDYWHSIEWRQKVRKYIKEAHYRCEYCGLDNVGLEAHHLHYHRVGNEQPGDIMIACKPCHKVLDFQRKTEERDARRLYRNLRPKPKQMTLF